MSNILNKSVSMQVLRANFIGELLGLPKTPAELYTSVHDHAHNLFTTQNRVLLRTNTGIYIAFNHFSFVAISNYIGGEPLHFFKGSDLEVTAGYGEISPYGNFKFPIPKEICKDLIEFDSSLLLPADKDKAQSKECDTDKLQEKMKMLFDLCDEIKQELANLKAKGVDHDAE